MSKKILVVDDERDFVNIIEDTLESAGYNVITAFNGKEALEKVRNHAPDLVILDVNMPEVDGFSVCAELRKDPLYAKLPVIFLTVRRQEKDKVKGLLFGSDEYLTKPFRPKELLLRLKKYL